MAHALIVEGADPEGRAKADEILERAGHEVRARLDPVYKRATWGLRPEDLADQQALITDLQARRG